MSNRKLRPRYWTAFLYFNAQATNLAYLTVIGERGIARMEATDKRWYWTGVLNCALLLQAFGDDEVLDRMKVSEILAAAKSRVQQLRDPVVGTELVRHDDGIRWQIRLRDKGGQGEREQDDVATRLVRPRSPFRDWPAENNLPPQALLVNLEIVWSREFFMRHESNR